MVYSPSHDILYKVYAEDGRPVVLGTRITLVTSIAYIRRPVYAGFAGYVGLVALDTSVSSVTTDSSHTRYARCVGCIRYIYFVSYSGCDVGYPGESPVRLHTHFIFAQCAGLVASITPVTSVG